MKIIRVIYSQLNKGNFDKGIGLIHSGANAISEIAKGFDNPKKGHGRKSSFNHKDFWGESKESRKENMSFYGEKMSFSSNKKIGFW